MSITYVTINVYVLVFVNVYVCERDREREREREREECMNIYFNFLLDVIKHVDQKARSY